MKKPKMHARCGHGEYVVLCGSAISAGQSTPDPKLVTCKSCLTWLTFYEAKKAANPEYNRNLSHAN
jgi:hypothetical protein